MKRKALAGVKVFGLAAILFLGIVSIIASGGGGSSTVPATSNYKGITTQAKIDGDNAELLAVGAWLGGQLGTRLDIFGAVQTGPESGGNSFSLGLIPSLFEDVILNIGVSFGDAQPYAGIVVEYPTYILGSCNESPGFVIEGGATVPAGWTLNENTGAFSFTINFDNYCEWEQGEAVTINGTAKMSGTIDLSTLYDELPEFSKFTMTFSSLTLEYLASGDSITIMGESSSKKGIFSADWNVSPNLVTMSYVIKDNNSDPVVTYWFKNVQIELEGGEGSTDLTGMTGRFYDPLFGFVEMSVGVAIHMLDGEYGPESGSLIVTGAEGTKALLSFLDVSSYQVDADTDGDGEYDDYSSGQQFWADL
jgi:hypothetical protein